MKIGITGDQGFIGSKLILNLRKKWDCYPLIRGYHDLLRVASLKPFVEDKDVIIHLAGVNRAQNDMQISANTLGTANLLEAMRLYSNCPVKIIFSSTLQVYGTNSEKKLFSEKDPLVPKSVYGLSKKWAEELIMNYCDQYGICGIIFRISNVYGPGCKPFYNSAISTFVHQLKCNEKILINGSGKQTRDYIYIHDVMSAFEQAIEYDPHTLEIFNLCSGKPTSINELIHLLKMISCSDPIIEYCQCGLDDDHLIGDPSKAKKVLRFKPEYSLEQGLIHSFNMQY